MAARDEPPVDAKSMENSAAGRDFRPAKEDRLLRRALLKNIKSRDEAIDLVLQGESDFLAPSRMHVRFA